MLSQFDLRTYRAQTFYTAPGKRLASVDQAVDYVNQRGFIFFWPVKGVLMPSLWTATAGDRPVPDAHDDPGHVTWGWKDGLLGKGRCFYGRILRKRNTFIALDLLPYFYALSPNYGDPSEDYLIDYEQGRLTAAAKNLYEALLRLGPQHTIDLRKNAGLTGSDSEFNHALEELQTTFRILPVGVAEAGAWRYAHIYDIVARHYPNLVEEAHAITEPDARQKLIETYLRAVGAVPVKEVQRLFGYQPSNWPLPTIERDLRKMADRGVLRLGVELEGCKDPCVALPELIRE